MTKRGTRLAWAGEEVPGAPEVRAIPPTRPTHSGQGGSSPRLEGAPGPSGPGDSCIVVRSDDGPWYEPAQAPVIEVT